MTRPAPFMTTITSRSGLMKMMTSQPTPWELELIQADNELRQLAREQAIMDIRKLMQAHDIDCEQICPAKAAKA